MMMIKSDDVLRHVGVVMKQMVIIQEYPREAVIMKGVRTGECVINVKEQFIGQEEIIIIGVSRPLKK